jgi:hypothetical protein
MTVDVRRARRAGAVRATGVTDVRQPGPAGRYRAEAGIERTLEACGGCRVGAVRVASCADAQFTGLPHILRAFSGGLRIVGTSAGGQESRTEVPTRRRGQKIRQISSRTAANAQHQSTFMP